MAGKKQQIRAAAKERQVRKQRQLIGFGAVVLLLVAVVFTFSARSRNEPRSQDDVDGLTVSPKVGALAPDFSLKDVNGQPVALSDFRGKPVAMMFFHTY